MNVTPGNPPRVEVSEGSVYIDGKRICASDDLAEAIYEPTVDAMVPERNRGGRVCLHGPRRAFIFATDVDSRAEAESLLRALPVDVRNCDTLTVSACNDPTGQMRLSPFIVAMALSFPLGTLIGFRVSLLLFALSSLFSLALALRIDAWRRIRIGATLEFGIPLLRRSVPMSELEEVHAIDRRTIRLTRRGKRDLDLDVGLNCMLDSGRLVPVRDIVIDRIQRARGRSIVADVCTPTLGARLARGSRSIEAWIGEIRSLRKTEGAYRTSKPREADLWDVIDDREATDDARAAAALLVEHSSTNRERLRIAARDVASSRLCMAFEKIADATSDPFDSVVTCVAGEARPTRFG